MPAFTASAPGKIILFGEHAVVYGQPAIAVPVTQVCARATVTPEIRGKLGEVRIVAADIALESSLAILAPGNPIGEAIKQVCASLKINHIPACTLKISSTIPVASGLGSGAAVTVAIIRALSGFLGHPLRDAIVSALAFEVEKIHHGTPSGIDNTVVTYAQPVFFIRPTTLHPSPSTPIIQTFTIAKPFTILIGDTGFPSPTKESVGNVRIAWENDPALYARLFAAAGSIAKTARQAIERGFPERLGPLMDENHELLQEMNVSSPELDRLVCAAKDTGALGAKLSGGGRGGNMIALVEENHATTVAQALRSAGAINTIVTQVKT